MVRIRKRNQILYHFLLASLFFILAEIFHNYGHSGMNGLSVADNVIYLIVGYITIDRVLSSYNESISPM